MMDRKDIFMSGFKSKIGYSFTYKDLAEFEAIIDFYEQQAKKQKEIIEWLEDKIQQQETLMAENQEKLYFLMYEDEKEDLKLYSRKAYTRRIILEEILQKYKEIIGGKHE